MIKETGIGENEWDQVILPKTKWYHFDLAEIWRYKDLLMLLVKRDFAAQYKQTILGPMWHLIQPAMTTIMFLLVFGKIAKIPTDGIPPVLFYMAGITIWNYFASCLNNTSNTFIANAGIFSKVYFPRLILPISVVISNLIRFGIQLFLFVVLMLIYHVKGEPLYFSLSWLIIPFLLFLMAALGLGLGIIISSLTTKYRDLNVLIVFGVQLLMYITPIAYPLSYLKGSRYEWWIRINPLTGITETFKYCIFNKGIVDVGMLGYSIVITVFILFLGLMMFNKAEKTFMDTI